MYLNKLNNSDIKSFKNTYLKENNFKADSETS